MKVLSPDSTPPISDDEEEITLVAIKEETEPSPYKQRGCLFDLLDILLEGI